MPERNLDPIVEVDIRSAPSSTKNWADRLEKSRDDRVVLARFLAACLVAVAIVNVIPSIIYWQHWNSLDEFTKLPRWVYIQVFVALLHVVYASLLFQVPDWATLKAVSWAMLFVAMAFGLVSTGLILGGESGFVAENLGLAAYLVRRAGLWCVAMLCVATLASYLGGRESARWQRVEKLFFAKQKSAEH